MKKKLACLVVLLGSFGIGSAAAETSPDLHYRYPHYHATIVIQPDGTAVESREWLTDPDVSPLRTQRAAAKRGS